MISNTQYLEGNLPFTIGLLCILYHDQVILNINNAPLQNTISQHTHINKSLKPFLFLKVRARRFFGTKKHFLKEIPLLKVPVNDTPKSQSQSVIYVNKESSVCFCISLYVKFLFSLCYLHKE